jgi:hypothetical protein
MAIGKWIPFSSSNPAAAAQNAKPEAVQAITSADAKKFGLENVSLCNYYLGILEFIIGLWFNSLAIPGES